MHVPPSDWRQISTVGNGFIPEPAIQLLEERDIALADNLANAVPSYYYYSISHANALASGVASSTFKVPPPQWVGDPDDYSSPLVLAKWNLRTSTGGAGAIGDTWISFAHPGTPTLSVAFVLPTSTVGTYTAGSVCSGDLNVVANYFPVALTTESYCNTSIKVNGGAGLYWQGTVELIIMPRTSTYVSI